MYRFLSSLLSSSALALSGCSHDRAALPADGEEPSASELGSVSLALVTEAADGSRYRLRGALFTIENTRSQFDAGVGLVTTETDPDAQLIQVRLVAGEYAVRLLPGWRMEQVSPQRDVVALLLSESTQRVNVERFEVSRVQFVFGVNGDASDFGGGLDIGVSVIEPDAGH